MQVCEGVAGFALSVAASMLAGMRISVRVSTLAVVVALSIAAGAQSAPRVVTMDPSALAAKKADPLLVKTARSEAEKALKFEPVSVIAKTKTPPSGDKRDYMSMARYFWPNPDTPNHLPYVRHDGKTNPEINEIPDHEYLDHTASAARALALGYYVTGDEKYAAKAAELLRYFFLSPTTGMNPNLKYAQYIPGVNTGRGTGILDARPLAVVVDALGLLQGAKSWSATDEAAMSKWMSAYYEWVTKSKAGEQEHAAPNNHGSWYAAQVAAIARYLGKMDDLKRIAEEVRDKRIPAQFDKAGMQKYEMERTNSFSYSAFNLEALTQLAQTVAPTGVDLYAVKPGILAGLDALLPYDSQHKWPHEQIVEGKEDSICPALIRAAAKTGEAMYVEGEKRFACKVSAVRLVDGLKP